MNTCTHMHVCVHTHTHSPLSIYSDQAMALRVMSGGAADVEGGGHVSFGLIC